MSWSASVSTVRSRNPSESPHLPVDHVAQGSLAALTVSRWPSREPVSPPRPDRLFQVSDARRSTMENHLAHLVDDGSGGRMDQVAEEGKLDHRTLALGNPDQPWHTRLVQIGEWHAVDGGDLAGIRRELARRRAPHDDRRDDEPRARRVVVERTQHGFWAQREPGLFLE